MMDPTNIPPAINAAPVAVQSTLNAWHVVALMVGGIVIHAYHTVVNAGGTYMIRRRFRYGPTGQPPVDDQKKGTN